MAKKPGKAGKVSAAAVAAARRVAREEAAQERLVKILEKASRRDGAVNLPPPDLMLYWRKQACFSLTGMTIAKIDDSLTSLRARVSGAISKSAVADYLLMSAPKISPEAFVKANSIRPRGRGVPHYQLRSDRSGLSKKGEQ